jgi:hypothetical protein
MALTDAELDAQIKENDKKMADAEAAFEKVKRTPSWPKSWANFSPL